MSLPNEIKIEIEKLVSEIQRSKATSDAKNISLKYRTENGKGKRLLTGYDEAVSYSATRMPATFGAISKALDYTLEVFDISPKTLLDVGAGTGASGFAAVDKIESIEEITCLERENAMQEVGKKLYNASSSPALKNANWITYDITSGEIKEPKDLVIASYMLNELSNPERIKALSKLWNAANMVLLLIEPGTPAGYKQLIEAREILINQGAYMIAPCPHQKECPLTGNDWCHFSCRIERSKIHKQLKNASMGYEDEKFSYMAFSKTNFENINSRVIKKPLVEKGKTIIELCQNDGRVLEKIINKRNKEAFKKIRKLEWGDVLSEA